MDSYDVAVIGAGAAGMMCAAVAGQRGRRVVLIDHARRLAEKIRISGGGRCNFTNRDAGPAAYLSANPAFCRSALARYTPQDFLRLMARHRIAWHEKHRGQLFCDDSSEDVIEMLRRECEAGSVSWRMPCAVAELRQDGEAGFILDADGGPMRAARVVLATGGMAVPQVGATDFALRIARQFGMKIIEPRPALVPLVFDSEAWRPFAALSGVAQEVDIATGKGKAAGRFREDLLFTHRGLSGPAVLQISSYWQPGEAIAIDLAPGMDVAGALLAAKPGSRQQIDTVLTGLGRAAGAQADAQDEARAGHAGLVPRRLAESWLGAAGLAGKRLADLPDKALRSLGEGLNGWRLVPSGTAGYKKAEVMRGGIDTRELNQQDMQSRRVPGLYVIGEAVDVTGWLGGYNFQWAWASAMACALGL